MMAGVTCDFTFVDSRLKTRKSLAQFFYEMEDDARSFLDIVLSGVVGLSHSAQSGLILCLP